MSSLTAILENIGTQPQLDEWLASPTRDIHAHLMHLSSSPDRRPYTASSYSSNPPAAATRSVRSGSSMSMAHAVIHQSSNASQQAPSLCNYTEVTPTETSISTAQASYLPGVPLLEDNNGVLERQSTLMRRPMYQCPFWFLSCSYVTEDVEEWRTHCLAHFRGEEPPRSVTCPLCDDLKLTCADGWTAWEYRMQHLADHHEAGHTLRTSRPDFHLFQHLWQKHLIDDQDLKELKGSSHHNLRGPPGRYTTSGSGTSGREARREARRRGQQRAIAGR